MDPLTSGDHRSVIVSQDDHRGVLWVVSILCLIYVLCLMAIRTAARRREFGWDDWVALAGTVRRPSCYPATGN
jgi:hypothetical protein